MTVPTNSATAAGISTGINEWAVVALASTCDRKQQNPEQREVFHEHNRPIPIQP